jgi:Hydrazine synthase alpha subunit middle domain
MLRVAILGASASLLAGGAVWSGLPPFVYTAAPRYEEGAWNQGGERFPDGAHLVLVAGGVRRELVPGFFASADAAVSYDGRRVLFAGRPARQDRWQIWQLDLAGGAPNRVAANSDACIRPLYLPDGRIAYTRVTPTGSQIEVVQPESGKADVLTYVPGRYLTDDILRDGRILFEWRGDLFTVYPDGTGVESLRCDHGPQRSGGWQVSSGDVIFGVAGGLARFTSALAFQEKLPPPADLEMQGPVAEVTPGRWLVAARRRSGGVYCIYEAGPRMRDPASVESLHGVNAVEPVVVSARVPPREFPSGLVPTRKTGNLLCLDAREAKNPIEGKVHSVRFYALGAGGGAQLLGQTAVAPDGSFYVEVPADRPVRMELLNAAGVRLRAEEHWFWMRPSEQRICVGCHAGPERAPENKVPEILTQTLTPVKMLGDHGRPQ